MADNIIQPKNIQDQIAEINTKMTALMHLLSGNEFDKEQGMVYTIKALKSDNATLTARVVALEKYKDRIKWVAGALCIPAGAGMGAFFDFIQNLLQKAG